MSFFNTTEIINVQYIESIDDVPDNFLNDCLTMGIDEDLDVLQNYNNKLLIDSVRDFTTNYERVVLSLSLLDVDNTIWNDINRINFKDSCFNFEIAKQIEKFANNNKWIPKRKSSKKITARAN